MHLSHLLKLTGSHTPLDDALYAVRKPLIGIVIFSFFINLATFAVPLYTLQIFNRVLASQNITTLTMLTLAVIIAIVTQSALEQLKSAVLRRCGIEIERVIGPILFETVHRAMIEAPGTIGASAMRNLENVREFFAGDAVSSILDLPWFPIFLLALWLLHPAFVILALGGVVINIGLTWLSAREAAARVKRSQEAQRVASDRAVAIFSNAEVVQSMGMRASLRRLWARDQLEALAWQATINDRSNLYASLARMVRMIVYNLSYAVAAYLIINRDLSAGHMLAVSIITNAALRPVDQITGRWKQLIAAHDSYNKLAELFRTYPSKQLVHSLPRPEGRVTFEHVSIAAPIPPGSHERPNIILRDITFDLPPGKTLAIIGPSAAGKTTLLKCILGVWKPIFGEIRIDGAEISHWDEHGLGLYFGYLPQEVGLFGGTVSENIGRFSAEATVEKVHQAAKLARVHEMILTLPLGYNTLLGEGGRGLSGGQRQRIGLARAVFGIPAIIVLDEPNSNLDAVGESQLIETLLELKQHGTTVIFVTHKANLLAAADHVLVLGQGTVQRYGTREEVQQQFNKNRAVPLQPRAVAP